MIPKTEFLRKESILRWKVEEPNSSCKEQLNGIMGEAWQDITPQRLVSSMPRRTEWLI